MHIATTETFFIDALDVGKNICWICDRTTDHRLGWIGVQCLECKSVYELEFTMPDIVKMRRDLMNLSRKEIAVKLNYSVKSIRTFENQKCSQKYFNRTSQLIREYFDTKNMKVSNEIS